MRDINLNDGPPGRFVQPRRNAPVFLWKDERIERYRLDSRVRNAADRIDHSVFDDQFYEVLPVAMELVKGAFMLLSVRAPDAPRKFRDRYAPMYTDEFYVFEFLKDSGEVFAVAMHYREYDSLVDRKEYEWCAELIEKLALDFLQKERRDQK